MSRMFRILSWVESRTLMKLEAETGELSAACSSEVALLLHSEFLALSLLGADDFFI
jgi:hypothetical protein